MSGEHTRPAHFIRSHYYAHNSLSLSLSLSLSRSLSLSLSSSIAPASSPIQQRRQRRRRRRQREGCSGSAAEVVAAAAAVAAQRSRGSDDSGGGSGPAGTGKVGLPTNDSSSPSSRSRFRCISHMVRASPPPHRIPSLFSVQRNVGRRHRARSERAEGARGRGEDHRQGEEGGQQGRRQQEDKQGVHLGRTGQARRRDRCRQGVDSGEFFFCVLRPPVSPRQSSSLLTNGIDRSIDRWIDRQPKACNIATTRALREADVIVATSISAADPQLLAACGMYPEEEDDDAKSRTRRAAVDTRPKTQFGTIRGERCYVFSNYSVRDSEVRDAMYFLIIQYEIPNSVANRLRLPLSNTPPPSTTRHNCRKNSHWIICPLFRPHSS